MKKFMLLHYGFETPTPEIMKAWGEWFESIDGITVDRGGQFPIGREISAEGVREMPMAADSITGYTIIAAEDLDAAQAIAERNPYIRSIRVYEIAN